MESPPQEQERRNLRPIGPTPRDDSPQAPAGHGRRWILFIVLAPLAIAVFIGLLYGNNLPGFRYIDRAQQRIMAGDKQGALSDLNAEAQRSSDMPEVYKLRGDLLLEFGDYEGAEKDFNKLVELGSQNAETYSTRSHFYQRQSFTQGRNRHREAIDDLTTALKFSARDNPLPYNNRAYARALAGMELEEGMADAERAVAFARQRAEDPIDSRAEGSRLETKGSLAACLDTRGYLHHLLGNQKQAVEDLDLSIKLSQELKKDADEVLKKAQQSEVQRALFAASVDRTLSVLHHHRALAHEKLGNAEQAKSDFELAKKLGYNPASGVF